MNSIGATLTDTLDDLIQSHRIDPQLAMKILSNFDRAVADILQDKVKARLTFKVRRGLLAPCALGGLIGLSQEGKGPIEGCRGSALAFPKQNEADLGTFCDRNLGLPGYLPFLRRGVDIPD